MAFDPAGTMLLSMPSQGLVVALPDRNNDGVADEVVQVASGLNLPHGLAFRQVGKAEIVKRVSAWEGEVGGGINRLSVNVIGGIGR